MNYLMNSFVQNTNKRLVPFKTGFSARERFKCFNTSGIGFSKFFKHLDNLSHEAAHNAVRIIHTANT